MPDTKLRPRSTVKSKDNSSEQRFSNVNATNRKIAIHIIKLVTEVKKTLKYL